MKKSFPASTAALIAGAALFVQSGTAQAAELQVICSNGIKGAIEKLLPEYERTSHQHVAIQYGASMVLRRGIEAGQAFDLAILTPGVIDELTKEGKLASGSSLLAKSSLAVGIRAGAAKADISTPDAIKRRLLAAKSVTYAKEGATTAAINEMLHHLGIADQINAKTVYQPPSGKAEESVADGENELVLAPLSEIVPVHGIEPLGLFPKEFQVPLFMSASLSAKPANGEAAEALVKFLTSSAAAPAIKASGMEMVSHKK